MKKASDVKGLGYNRIVPKFLQQYSHMLEGRKNQYTESHQLDRQDNVFGSVEQIEADGAVIVEKESAKRQRAALDGDDGEDEQPTVVEEESATRKIVDSSERFSSQRRPATEEIDGQHTADGEHGQNTAAAEQATPALPPVPVFKPKRAKSGQSTEEKAAAKKEASKKKSLLSFDAEDEG